MEMGDNLFKFLESGGNTIKERRVFDSFFYSI